MWKADPKFWGRTSPVLFPFVGAVKEKQFRTKGQTYTMGQHGFARDMDFTLDSKTEVHCSSDGSGVRNRSG
jgi:galactose mutarotase-like enzyme